MSEVFISYSSRDRDLAQEIHDWLAADVHRPFLGRIGCVRRPGVSRRSASGASEVSTRLALCHCWPTATD
jgi:hypothetical protein